MDPVNPTSDVGSKAFEFVNVQTIFRQDSLLSSAGSSLSQIVQMPLAIVKRFNRMRELCELERFLMKLT